MLIGSCGYSENVVRAWDCGNKKVNSFPFQSFLQATCPYASEGSKDHVSAEGKVHQTYSVRNSFQHVLRRDLLRVLEVSYSSSVFLWRKASRLWHIFSTRRGIVQRFTLVYLVWIGCGGFQYINFQNFLSNSSGYLQQSYAFSDISSLNHVTSCVPDNKSLNCSYQFHKVYFSWHLL